MTAVRALVHGCLFAVACSSDPGPEPEPVPEGVDIRGVYQTTRHTRNDDACVDEGPAVTLPPYFMFSWEGYTESTYSFRYYDCDRADAESCYPRWRGYTLDTAEADGWSGNGLHADPFLDLDGYCEVLRTEGRVTVAEDGSVTYVETVTGATVPDPPCDDETALPCRFYEVIEGAPL